MPSMADLARNGSLNWTELRCSWFDNVKQMQNGFYWSQGSYMGVLVALYALVCSFGACANLVVVLTFLRTATLHTLRNSFIVNLAFSDLLLCVVTAPATLYLSVHVFWPFGDASCKVLACVQAVNMFVSCLTLVLIAADRVLLTLCPVKWRLAARAPLVCYGVVWLVSALVALPYSLAVSAEVVDVLEPWNLRHTPHMLRLCGMEAPRVCIEKTHTWEARLPFSKLEYTLAVLAVQYLLPLCGLGFAYIHIGTTIRRRVKTSTTIDESRRVSFQHKNRRALFFLLLLVLIYAISWLPINAYNVLNVLDLIEFSQYRYLFCHLIGITSACINPITYALVNEGFRSALLSSFQSCPCVSSTPAPRNTFSFSLAHTKPPRLPMRTSLTDAERADDVSRTLL